MITSNSNQQVKNLNALIKKAKERKLRQQFVVEGTKMVQEAPRDWLRAVFVSESYAARQEHRKLLEELAGRSQNATKMHPLIYEILSDTVFKCVSDTQTPQGILAVVDMPSYDLSRLLRGDRTMLLILESVQDPGNLGTMIRTGEGAGVTGVIMNRTTVDLFNPKTIRSTMGSIYRMPFYIAEDLAKTVEELKERGVRLYAAHLRGTATYDAMDYRMPVGFMIGNEGNGLSGGIADLSDDYVRIPMEGKVESLNAAISAALLVYEANRQRRCL